MTTLHWPGVLALVCADGIMMWLCIYQAEVKEEYGSDLLELEDMATIDQAHYN
jgi:hypothetical protein